MKRKSWLFLLYSVLVITAVVLLLVFWPDKDTSTLPENNNNGVVEEDNGNKDNNENDNNEDNHELPIEIYATSLTINLPSTINILKDTSASLLDGYVVVLPSEASEKLKIEITPRYNSSAFGLELLNSTLTAKQVGTYNLTFIVPKSASTNISKSVLVTVYEEEINSHAIQLQNTLTVGESINLNDIFEIKGTNYSVLVDDKMNYASSIISAVKVGDGTIKLLFTENYVQYIYEFKMVIKQQPQHTIVLNNVSNNTIEIDLAKSSVFFINYEIQDREEGEVLQTILYNMSDSSVAIVEDVMSPLIKLRALTIGTTTLTLTCVADTSIQIEITIIVK